MFRAQSSVPKISLLGAASQRVWAQSGVTSWRKSAMERFCLARVFDSGSLGSTWEMKWNPDSRRHVVADSRHSTYEMDCAVLIEVRRRSSFSVYGMGSPSIRFCRRRRDILGQISTRTRVGFSNTAPAAHHQVTSPKEGRPRNSSWAVAFCVAVVC